MTNLKGSEKQIKWANDIVEKEISKLEAIKNTITTNEIQVATGFTVNNKIKTYNYETKNVCKTEEMFEKELSKLEETIKIIQQIEDAKYIIDNRNDLVEAVREKHNLKKYIRLENAYSIVKSHEEEKEFDKNEN